MGFSNGELGLHDDSAKSAFLSELPDLPLVQPKVITPSMSFFLHSDFENTNPNPNPFGFMIDNGNRFDFVVELIRVATALKLSLFSASDIDASDKWAKSADLVFFLL
ncbi:hypothetical protein L6452_02995 [Arctium lappa]|uniref:Uncharacterized protein n=1 Tax=Arctium lappa TaxID=4217 RepID=A0ACB9FLX1_ARCLA|nr:hypothetical protein L6452_02995 [Arctium lappa]